MTGHPLAFSQDELSVCFEQAQTRYQVPAWLLWSVGKVESGFNAKAINVNANGTRDLGLMQINTGWLPALKAHGIREEHLWDPCTNIMVGAWVMAQNIQALGWNWEAIGAYNARSSSKRNAYAWKIYRTAFGDARVAADRVSRR